MKGSKKVPRHRGGKRKIQTAERTGGKRTKEKDVPTVSAGLPGGGEGEQNLHEKEREQRGQQRGLSGRRPLPLLVKSIGVQREKERNENDRLQKSQGPGGYKPKRLARWVRRAERGRWRIKMWKTEQKKGWWGLIRTARGGGGKHDSWDPRSQTNAGKKRRHTEPGAGEWGCLWGTY